MLELATSRSRAGLDAVRAVRRRKLYLRFARHATV